MLDFDPRHSTQKVLDQNHYVQKMNDIKELFPRTGWCVYIMHALSCNKKVQN